MHVIGIFTNHGYALRCDPSMTFCQFFEFLQHSVLLCSSWFFIFSAMNSSLSQSTIPNINKMGVLN
jgi:hypothetical protein